MTEARVRVQKRHGIWWWCPECSDGRPTTTHQRALFGAIAHWHQCVIDEEPW